MSNQAERLQRLENEVQGNGQPGIKDKLIRVEIAVKDIPAIKKRVDINTVMTAATLVLVLRPNLIDAIDWLFKLLHV